MGEGGTAVHVGTLLGYCRGEGMLLDCRSFYCLSDSDSAMNLECQRRKIHLAAHNDATGCLGYGKTPYAGVGYSVNL